jgi:hypothetical protein
MKTHVVQGTLSTFTIGQKIRDHQFIDRTSVVPRTEPTAEISAPPSDVFSLHSCLSRTRFCAHTDRVRW